LRVTCSGKKGGALDLSKFAKQNLHFPWQNLHL
jgi:hypothetical protein